MDLTKIHWHLPYKWEHSLWSEDASPVQEQKSFAQTQKSCSWWLYRCTNQLVPRASANSVVGKYVKHRDEEKQEECLPKAASFAGVLFNYLNRQGGVQSDFSGAEHSAAQVWSYRAVWFKQSAWTQAVTPDKTTQLPAQKSCTTSSSSEDRGKNDLGCSSVQRDAEITSARASFHWVQAQGWPVQYIFCLYYIRSEFGLLLVHWGFCWFLFWLCHRRKVPRHSATPHIFICWGGKKNRTQLPLVLKLCTPHYLPLIAILEPVSLQTLKAQTPRMIHRRSHVCKHQC